MIYQKLTNVFDFVGVINVDKYPNYKKEPLLDGFLSMFVVGLSYPNIFLPQKHDKLNASMYTYGIDYHIVIKKIIDEALKGEEYQVYVDNHELNERKALELTGLAYLGKNNLMINKDFGSYFFIGLVVTKTKYDEVITKNTDSCGNCVKCIKACPVNALFDGFDITKCLSAVNQSKKPFSDEEIAKNYLLLGCDICQRVCPKNKGIVNDFHDHFKTSEETYVLIDDLFKLSNKEFMKKYGKQAYSWRGKTLLLRNALTILLKQKNTSYNEEIKKTLVDDKYPSWYKEDASKILRKLEELC